MNFNIIETDYTKDFNERYTLIKEELSNGLSVSDIKEKYEMSDGKWRKYYKQLVEDGIFKPRARSQKEAKFYTHHNGRYIVQKWKKDRKQHIGTFKCEADAKKCVQLMKQCKWDLEQKTRIVNEVKRKSTYEYN